MNRLPFVGRLDGRFGDREGGAAVGTGDHGQLPGQRSFDPEFDFEQIGGGKAVQPMGDEMA